MKITDPEYHELVQNVLDRRAQNVTASELSKEFQISRVRVMRIIHAGSLQNHLDAEGWEPNTNKQQHTTH